MMTTCFLTPRSPSLHRAALMDSDAGGFANGETIRFIGLFNGTG
jgi:hypothetical protein